MFLGDYGLSAEPRLHILGPSWGCLGAVWGGLGAVWGRLGAVLESSWAVLGCPGAVLEPFWGRPGAVLAPLGPSLDPRAPPPRLPGPSRGHPQPSN